MAEESAPNGHAGVGALAVVGGADQSGVRLYNERLILSLVRRYGPLAKIDVARLTGLSVQSTTAIMNRLLEEGLLRREAPLRGKVGQPTTPMSLDPEGAFSIGLTIGRRNCDLVLVDFCGGVRRRARATYPYPEPSGLVEFVAQRLPALVADLKPRERARIAGVGLAMPFEIWDWPAEIGAPADALARWKSFDVAGEVEKVSSLPTTLANDATAACAAEFVFGQAWRRRDFLYVFVGAFVGGGIVLNGALFPGRTGNAGALGSMPVARASGRGAEQLIARASIRQLETRITAAGGDPSSIWRRPDAWDDYGAPLDAWIEDAAQALAQAALAAAAVIDFEAVVIDGAMPAAVRERLCARVAAACEGMDRRGLSRLDVVPGVVGADAPAIGGAALPLIKNFARDREVLFKDGPIGAP